MFDGSLDAWPQMQNKKLLGQFIETMGTPHYVLNLNASKETS